MDSLVSRCTGHPVLIAGAAWPEFKDGWKHPAPRSDIALPPLSEAASLLTHQDAHARPAAMIRATDAPKELAKSSQASITDPATFRNASSAR
ncbi:MAG: hypothetical protein WBF53_12980 [Litorimonas sp.]